MWKYLGIMLYLGFGVTVQGPHATESNNDMWVDLAAGSTSKLHPLTPRSNLILKCLLFIHIFKTFLFY